MKIFVGNLPTLEQSELHKFQSKWNISASEQVDGRDRSGRVYRYFLTHFNYAQEKKAHRLIKRLNGSSFLEHRIEAREYVRRAFMNERRSLDWRSKPWHKEERRLGERRGS